MTTASEPAQKSLQELSFRLTYGDCDPAGIVYFAAYFPWMERANTEWHVAVGAPVNSMLGRWGATEITRHAACDYLLPAQLHDRLTVSVCLVRLGRTSFELAFPFRRESDGATTAVGSMVTVMIDEERRPVPIPEFLVGKLGL